MPSTSYRPRGTLERSLDARAAVLQQADKLVDRLNNIRRGQVCLVHVYKMAFIGYPVTSLPNHLATKKYVSYRQEEPANLISRVLLRMRRIYVANVRLDFR